MNITRMIKIILVYAFGFFRSQTTVKRILKKIAQTNLIRKKKMYKLTVKRKEVK